MELHGFSLTVTTPDYTYMPTGIGTNEAVPDAELVDIQLVKAANCGYKSAALRIVGGAAQLYPWYYVLGRKVVIWGPDGQPAWEGMCYGLDFSWGVSYHLSPLYTAVKVVYSDDIGTRAETGWITTAARSAVYGRKELVHSVGGMTPSAAVRLRDLLQYFTQYALGVKNFDAPRGAPTGRQQLDVALNGFYTTLGWERWVQQSEGQVDTGTQLNNIINSSSFVRTDTTRIPTTGVAVSQYRPDQYLTLQAEVQRLVKMGMVYGGSNVAYNVQVWNDQWAVAVRLGKNVFPQPIYYQDGDRFYSAADNGPVLPWKVDPDTVLVGSAHLPLGYGYSSDPMENPTAYYILETKYSVGQGRLSFPHKVAMAPAGWSDFLDMLLKGQGGL